MDWLHGPRILVNRVEANSRHVGFAPVKLNVDDLEQLAAYVRGVGLGGYSQVAGAHDSAGHGLEPPFEECADFANAHPGAVTWVRLSNVLPHADPSAGSGQMTLTITPLRVDLQFSGSDELWGRLSDAGDGIERLILMAPRGRMEALRLAKMLDAIYVAVWLALAVWVVVSLASLPLGILAGAVAFLALRGRAQRRHAIWMWLESRRGQTWLIQKSRAELNTERANSRRDWKVGSITGIGGAVIGALLTWGLPQVHLIGEAVQK